MTITVANRCTIRADGETRERPILMSQAMVRACLDGRKSQTRRVVKPEPQESHSTSFARDGSVIERFSFGWSWRYHPNAMGVSCPSAHMLQLCPYGVPGDRLWVRETFRPGRTGEPAWLYRADDPMAITPWRPAIFMPRVASRLTLTITEVRVERVQDITAADARAEGVASVAEYRELWDHLNAKRKDCAWGDNPWCWVVSFVRVQP